MEMDDASDDDNHLAHREDGPRYIAEHLSGVLPAASAGSLSRGIGFLHSFLLTRSDMTGVAGGGSARDGPTTVEPC